ncbi:unnamed protein product [Porites evermanni]|uniref:Uncharacterized protein n=1 Tax=Porites evermanni TaxID=104178 RepID=A0ABN8SNG7_9CNID|nr:unnamed protein product [Porites evermanni]
MHSPTALTLPLTDILDKHAPLKTRIMINRPKILWFNDCDGRTRRNNRRRNRLCNRKISSKQFTYMRFLQPSKTKEYNRNKNRNHLESVRDKIESIIDHVVENGIGLCTVTETW